MNKTALIPSLVAVLLSACAAGPDYQRPPIDTPAAFKEIGDWKPAEPREPLAADNWWAVFGDPVPVRSHETVLEVNYDVAVVEDRLFLRPFVQGLFNPAAGAPDDRRSATTSMANSLLIGLRAVARF